MVVLDKTRLTGRLPTFSIPIGAVSVQAFGRFLFAEQAVPPDCNPAGSSRGRRVRARGLYQWSNIEATGEVEMFESTFISSVNSMEAGKVAQAFAGDAVILDLTGPESGECPATGSAAGRYKLRVHCLFRVLSSLGMAFFQCAQFSVTSPETRSNSRRLLLARISSEARACAAIHRSLAPMGVPARSSFARIRA